MEFFFRANVGLIIDDSGGIYLLCYNDPNFFIWHIVHALHALSRLYMYMVLFHERGLVTPNMTYSVLLKITCFPTLIQATLHCIDPRKTNTPPRFCCHTICFCRSSQGNDATQSKSTLFVNIFAKTNTKTNTILAYYSGAEGSIHEIKKCQTSLVATASLRFYIPLILFRKQPSTFTDLLLLLV